jgi:riboflavin synthase
MAQSAVKSRGAPDVCENARMFTGIITGVGRIVATHDLGTSSSFGKRLSIAVPDGYLDDVGLATASRSTAPA